MRLACCLALAAIGCGAPAPLYRPVYVDPALGVAPELALVAWQEATGWRYPERVVSFEVCSLAEGRAGTTSRIGSDGAHFTVCVSPQFGSLDLGCVLRHELGHVAGLIMDPESGDPIHYHGELPSVMRRTADNCPDGIGRPELAAFELKYGR